MMDGIFLELPVVGGDGPTESVHIPAIVSVADHMGVGSEARAIVRLVDGRYLFTPWTRDDVVEAATEQRRVYVEAFLGARR